MANLMPDKNTETSGITQARHVTHGHAGSRHVTPAPVTVSRGTATGVLSVKSACARASVAASAPDRTPPPPLPV